MNGVKKISGINKYLMCFHLPFTIVWLLFKAIVWLNGSALRIFYNADMLQAEYSYETTLHGALSLILPVCYVVFIVICAVGIGKIRNFNTENRDKVIIAIAAIGICEMTELLMVLLFRLLAEAVELFVLFKYMELNYTFPILTNVVGMIICKILQKSFQIKNNLNNKDSNKGLSEYGCDKDRNACDCIEINRDKEQEYIAGLNEDVYGKEPANRKKQNSTKIIILICAGLILGAFALTGVVGISVITRIANNSIFRSKTVDFPLAFNTDDITVFMETVCENIERSNIENTEVEAIYGYRHYRVMVKFVLETGEEETISVRLYNKKNLDQVDSIEVLYSAEDSDIQIYCKDALVDAIEYSFTGERKISIHWYTQDFDVEASTLGQYEKRIMEEYDLAEDTHVTISCEDTRMGWRGKYNMDYMQDSLE